MVLCTIIDGNIYFMTSILLIVYYCVYVIVVVFGPYVHKKFKTKPSQIFSGIYFQSYYYILRSILIMS
jgi:hypothetical protein